MEKNVYPYSYFHLYHIRRYDNDFHFNFTLELSLECIDILHHVVILEKQFYELKPQKYRSTCVVLPHK